MKRFILTGTPGGEEAKRFETVHEAIYRAHGFDLIFIEPGSVTERVAAIRRAL
jgi:predicted ATPase